MKQKRPIHIIGDTAFVYLTMGYVAKIDASAINLVSGRNWFAVRKTNNGVDRHVYAQAMDGQYKIYMHRLICGVQKDCSLQIDHIDGDGLNNRSANLRVATASQNQRNQRKKSNNTSGYKGVSFHKSISRYTARIWHDGRQLHIGSFKTAEEAAAAYAKASELFHGEFGRTA